MTSQERDIQRGTLQLKGKVELSIVRIFETRGCFS